MTIDKDTVEHLAKLSRLHLSDNELLSFTKSINEILEYTKSIQQVNTEGVLPAIHALDLQNVFKEDEVINYKYIDKLFENAPDVENHSFKVPRILTN
ncbi:MAG: Asp-tRNA(Asn)/Glu-tRNA(Gln) amidotransferase subunit GatC [Candidatus Margulisbacteria bacterium]|nr:Asp-tRNA(Asn)/Glu-tRNA(Gln) amidotransferase subunit GatC [Candidatus Margulisiibacteriota bacterium]